MGYVTTTEVTLKMHDDTYARVRPGSALPTSFPEYQQTIRALLAARQIVQLSDEETPEVDLDVIPTRRRFIEHDPNRVKVTVEAPEPAAEEAEEETVEPTTEDEEPQVVKKTRRKR